MSGLAESAVAYAQAGLAVMPLQPGGKTPLTRHGLKEATSDTATVEGWWRQWPDANVGIATGEPSGIAVIDVDDIDSLAELEASDGPLPATLTAETGGGGLHLVYRRPTGGVRNSASKLAPGIDIRGDGGYIVAPPSIHSSGRHYRWATHDVPIGDWPSWVAERLSPAATNGHAAAQRTVAERAGDVGEDVADAWGRTVLVGELETIRAATPGSRNDSLFRGACNVFEAVKGQHVDERAAWDWLRTAAVDIGLDADESERTLESAWTRTDARHPAAPLTSGAGGDSVEEEGARAGGMGGMELARHLLAWSQQPMQRVTTGIREVDEMLRGGLALGRVHTLVGRSGSGKSLVAQHVLEANLDTPAVFFSFEMTPDEVAERALAMWLDAPSEEVHQAIARQQLDPEQMAAFGRAHQRQAVVSRGSSLEAMGAQVRRFGEQLGEPVRLVVIDYAELVTAGREGSADAAIENTIGVFRALKGWAEDHNVAVLVLHQTNRTIRSGRRIHEDTLRYGGYTESDVVVGLWRPHKWRPLERGEEPLTPWERDRLEQVVAVNVIKNRGNHAGVFEDGWEVPIRRSGRLDGWPANRLYVCEVG